MCDRVWVSDKKNNIMLINTTGDTLHNGEALCINIIKDCGQHTVNWEDELIFINGKYTINTLSKKLKKVSNFIKVTDKTLLP